MAGVKKGKGGSKSKGGKGKESKGNVKRTPSSHQVRPLHAIPLFRGCMLPFQVRTLKSPGVLGEALGVRDRARDRKLSAPTKWPLSRQHDAHLVMHGAYP